jgi:hypothetical protein
MVVILETSNKAKRWHGGRRKKLFKTWVTTVTAHPGNYEEVGIPPGLLYRAIIGEYVAPTT